MSAIAAGTAATPSAANNTTTTTPSYSGPSTRRRTASASAVAVKINLEKPVEGGTNGAAVANGIDPISTIPDRAREAPEPARRAATTPASSTRRRRLVPEERRRQTFAGVLFKICLLLLGLLMLGQMIWKWSEVNGRNADIPLSLLNYDGRISELEATVKKVTRSLQLQVEVVDKKMETEVGAVVRELKQAEEKQMLFEKELKKLESRSYSAEKYLNGLKDAELFTKEEFESFWNELKSRSPGKDISLDDVRDLARETVEKEIAKHAADGLGRIDYALASGGGKVVRHSEPVAFGKVMHWFAAGKGRNGVHANAHKMLEPSFGEPGQCFALQGSSGFVEIKLRTGIIPEAVTLEHVSKSVAFNISSAPRDCRVYAWFEGPNDDPSNRSQKMILLTDFSYDLAKSNIQTFNVESTNSAVINMVRLEFSSNYGSSLTCIYRFRVHGYEPNSI